ncbi:MAG: hypothetical protein ACKVK6_05970, partial [bacterium]
HLLATLSVGVLFVLPHAAFGVESRLRLGTIRRTFRFEPLFLASESGSCCPLGLELFGGKSLSCHR